MAIERVERTIIGKDGKQRKFIIVMKDKSIVFLGYEGYAKDYQKDKDPIV